MKIKTCLSKLSVVAIASVLLVSTQAAWAMKHHHVNYKPNCTGKGWHMVSVKCDIKPAQNWKQYDSGVYTQPIVGKPLLFIQ